MRPRSDGQEASRMSLSANEAFVAAIGLFTRLLGNPEHYVPRIVNANDE